MKKLMILFLALGSIGALVGCNTVDGVGEDMEAAGDSIQDAAN